MSNQEREIMASIKFDKSNIEEMEQIVRLIEPEVGVHSDYSDAEIDFMRLVILELKDHIEKIAKLENMLRTLMKKDDKEGINVSD
ncbi:MAG: hypothetical protein ACOCUH_02810 [Bacteriovoracia bacterium]